jgi:hypothetical protein
MLFKKLIAITIAYSFMLQLGSQFGAWVNYMANADYALEHCENKASKTNTSESVREDPKGPPTLADEEESPKINKKK